jgi:hypothetical protein
MKEDAKDFFATIASAIGFGLFAWLLLAVL